VGVREYAVSCLLFLCFIQIPSPTSLTHPLTLNQNIAKIASNPFNVFLSSFSFFRSKSYLSHISFKHSFQMYRHAHTNSVQLTGSAVNTLWFR